MRNQPRAMSKLIGAAVLATLLAACGSGGDSGSDGTPPDVVRIEFSVFDKETNVPLSGAVAIYQAGDRTYKSDPTNTDGSGRLDLPAAEVTKTDGTVSKVGYEPLPLLVSACSLQGGSVCILPVPMVKLSSISIPVGGDSVWHLGDSIIVEDDPTNSTFEKTTDTRTLIDADPSNDEPFLKFDIPDWASKVRSGGYTKATVTMDIKGMQTANCPNDAVALSGDAGTKTLPGANSPANGAWARESFQFAVADVGALSTNARLIVTTGKCLLGSDPDDFDDFEIKRLRVEFSK